MDKLVKRIRSTMRSPKLKITNIARIKQLRAGKDDFLERYLQYLENKVKNSITARLFPPTLNSLNAGTPSLPYKVLILLLIIIIIIIKYHFLIIMSFLVERPIGGL